MVTFSAGLHYRYITYVFLQGVILVLLLMRWLNHICFQPVSGLATLHLWVSA